jgi:hypothetical protein
MENIFQNIIIFCIKKNELMFSFTLVCMDITLPRIPDKLVQFTAYCQRNKCI